MLTGVEDDQLNRRFAVEPKLRLSADDAEFAELTLTLFQVRFAEKGPADGAAAWGDPELPDTGAAAPDGSGATSRKSTTAVLARSPARRRDPAARGDRRIGLMNRRTTSLVGYLTDEKLERLGGTRDPLPRGHARTEIHDELGKVLGA